MNPHFSDPEARAILNQRKEQRDAEYLLGQVGEATYLRSLFILGYLPDEARTQLKLLKMRAPYDPQWSQNKTSSFIHGKRE